MTITITEGTTDYNLYLNGQLTVDRLRVVSMYSKESIIDQAVTSTNNDRYTTISFTLPTEFGEQHLNGIYQYIAYNGTEIVDSATLKVITSPGGGFGTEPHISNNENRDAKVIYRPSYE